MELVQHKTNIFMVFVKYIDKYEILTIDPNGERKPSLIEDFINFDNVIETSERKAIEFYNITRKQISAFKSFKDVQPNTKIKSLNRAWGDFHELQTIKIISEDFKLKFEYEKELSKIIAGLYVKDSNFYKNQKRQIKFANLSALEIKKQIPQIHRIEWTGYSQEGSDDILVNDKFRISLKACLNCRGTLKNLGLSHSSLLSQFIDNKVFSYNQKLLDFHKYETFSEVKKKSQTNKKFKQSCIKLGNKVREKITKEMLKNLNNLSNANKEEFLKLIFDLKTDLLVVEVKEKEAQSYFPFKKYNFKNKKITFHKETDSCIKVKIDKKPLLRMQICGKNGLGISPFCCRVFLAGV